jgi:hypothetical protein
MNEMSEPMYPPNSHKHKEAQKQATTQEKQIQKVVKGPVKTKKNDFRKFADIFISEDVTNVKTYILMDVLVPAIKKGIYDIVTNGIDMILYGGTGKAKNGSNGSKVPYYSYSSNKNTVNYRGSENAAPRSAADYDDIIWPDRGSAERAKQQMQDIVATYGIVTVNDLYEMTPLTPPFTAQKYGWMDVSRAEVIRVRDGYVLKLPRAVPID